MAMQSIASNHLQAPNVGPTPRQQRRMTSPASMNRPDSIQPSNVRPPSPLRNAFVPDTSTGIDPDDSFDDDEDDEHLNQRSPSPSSSVSQLAASLAQRVGSFVGSIGPRSPGFMPSDAELEAEAERERDRSRREAEAILTREAKQRKLVEDRVLAMMETTKSLPPPPSRPLSNPPSPSGSQKEGTRWWSAAKNRLTPTKDKDPPTPAQQIILEAKAREKEKKLAKGKEKEKDWPSSGQSKYNDQGFVNLNLNPPVPPPQRRPVPSSPSSPTPSRPSLSNMPPNLSPSMRPSDVSGTSPSREAPPVYAQFTTQGTLDIPVTLLTIVKRFEKLEKWTVGHVRALEERMSDVERWLVDKEKENQEKESASIKETSTSFSSVQKDVEDMRDGLSELQGRVGELGREMAKINSSSRTQTPSQTPDFPIPPQTTSTSPLSTPHHTRLTSTTARESTSPPIASKGRQASGTRLPYPTGDYASPPDSTVLPSSTSAFSPTGSPTGSLNSTTRTRPLSIPGLPTTNTGTGLGILAPVDTSTTSLSASIAASLDRATSPPAPSRPPRATSPPASARPPRATSPPASTRPQRATSPMQNLSQPKSVLRPNSVSPTPRKRYTVALGEPITSRNTSSSESLRGEGDGPGVNLKRSGTPLSFQRPQSSIDGALMSSSGGDAGEDDDDDDSEFGGETIGKSAALRMGWGDASNAVPKTAVERKLPTATSTSPTPSPSNPNRRLRAQSAYILTSTSTSSNAGLQPPQTPITPLRLRSRSTERLLSGAEGRETSGLGSGKFVDPLVIRRQESRESTKVAMPKPLGAGKVPIGQLVAFFDGSKGGGR